jgi:hypothetical protein
LDGDDVTQQLRELAQRHAAGLISDDDFARQKQALLGSSGMRVSGAQETQVMPTIEWPDLEPPPSTRVGRNLLPLLVAVGVVIAVLLVVVLTVGAGFR